MSKFGSVLLCMAAGAILAAGLIFILRPAPSLSQTEQQAVQGTLNTILAKLDRIDKKLDTLSGRLGQVSSEVSRIYTRTGQRQERPRHDYWSR